MWSALKAMPILPKIILGVLVLGVAVKATTSHHSSTSGSYSTASYNEGSERNSYASRPSSDQSSELLAQFQSQHAQIAAQAQQCMVQINQAMQQQAAAAMNGQMYSNMPPCNQNMQMWTAQLAYLETEIYRIQTGDHRSSVGEITGTGSYGSQSSPSPSSGDDGTAALERYSREGIRGNSMYRDEDGETHELPSQPYYFRDRSSGQYIGSTSPNPPNDGRDYEVLTYSEHN
jgi:hypothetical protein